MTDRYARYERLAFDRPAPKVLRITMRSPLKMGAMDARMHREVSEIWRDVDADDSVNVVIFTGDGKTFSAGGDLKHERKVCDDYALRMRAMKESRDLVTNMLDCRKPIVTAARGWAVGAGLATVLLADVSIVAKDAKFSDGHLKIGVAAGDHAAIIWPILCGMAKAKYYLLTAETFTGEEAEKMNLVSLALPDEEVEARAVEIALRLAQGAPRRAALDKDDAQSLDQTGPADFRCLASPLSLRGSRGLRASKASTLFWKNAAPVLTRTAHSDRC